MATRRRRPSSAKKRPAKRARKKASSGRHNIHMFAIAALFSCGVLLGAFALNRVYVMYEEASIMAFAERVAADRAVAAQQKQQRESAQAARLQQERAQALAAAKAERETIAKQQKAELARQQKAQEARLKATQALAAALEEPAVTPAPVRANHHPNQLDQNNAQHAATDLEHAHLSTYAAAAQRLRKAEFSQYTPDSSANIVAIVIDDVGYQRRPGERTLALPGKLTVAVLPFTPYAKKLAELAPKRGKEVMLHAPMEPKKLTRWGEGLRAAMPEQQLRTEFVAMINNIPNLVGVNNHMGSGLTENSKIMAWLMEELPPRGLYFVDSRTSADSAAYDAARQAGVPTYTRDIFLDHSRDIKDIDRQFDKLVAASHKRGMALGIGHPYPETLLVLEQRLPELKKAGIELVTVSELLNARNARLQLANATERTTKPTQATN